MNNEEEINYIDDNIALDLGAGNENEKDDQHILIEDDENNENELLPFEENDNNNYITDNGEKDTNDEETEDNDDIEIDNDNDHQGNLDDDIMEENNEEQGADNNGDNNDDNDDNQETDEILQDDNNEEIEVELNANGRPRRQCAGAGVERLEMSFDNNKQYSSVRQRNNQFVMQSDKHPLIRGDKSFMSVAANFLFTQVLEHAQISAKAGIKRFGERAVAAMISEYKQLNSGVMPGKPVFGCIDAKSLTREEKRKALEAVNLIKKKRCGKIKGRTCANGSKQKRYLKHGETILSPTVSLEAIIGTLLIDANEGRDVAIFDVPGAYLQAEMPSEKKLLMVFRDEFVDIMCEVNPEYKDQVIEEKGKKVLYVKVLRAIYGCI